MISTWNSQICPEKLFENYFPDLLPSVKKSLNAYLKAYLVKILSYPKSFKKCDELIAKFIPQWAIMSSYSNHSISIHVYKMLYSVQTDLEFQKLDKYDRNIILWTCLLHDIAKRGYPVWVGRDYIHPFIGAGKVMHIFVNDLKFYQCKPELLDIWDKILEKSIRIDEKGKQVHDNGKLEDIFKLLGEIFKDNCFEKDVIILVLLHQSLPSMPEYDYHIVLSPIYEEIPKYFTKRLLMLMKLIIKHDSLSYLVGGKSWKFKQYAKVFDEIIEDIMKNSEWID